MRLKLILPAALASACSCALAAWSDLAPRPFENGGYLEVFGSGERDDGRSSAQSSGWSDHFFREKVTLFSNGYVYHPRFLRYQLSVSGGLKQEDYQRASVASAGWRRDSGAEYDGKLLFLPEHPYNLELFALRREPLYREQAATQHGTTLTSHGGHFRFRRKPYFLHAGYLDNTTSSGTASSSVRRLDLNGEYFKELGAAGQFSISASFTPSQFDSDEGLEGDSTQYGATGLLSIQRARLTVNATKNRYDQQSPLSGRIESDQYAVRERLGLELPLHFRTDLYYRVQDTERTVSDANPPGSRELTDHGQDFQTIVSHRLYQSLDTRYIFLRSSRSSAAGESTAMSHTLGLDYAKRIPRGRVLAGLNLATSRADNSGRPDVASEPHPGIAIDAGGVGTFNLDQPNVEQESLEVFVQSPVSPFESILLVRDVNYTVTLVGNTLQITVILLPLQFTLPGAYDFVASFSLVTGDFELRTDSYGFRASVELLDRLLTPYYSHLAIRSEVLSGVLPGSPPDSTTDTVGLAVQRGPWRAVGEYQSLDWSVSPYDAWRAELQYIESVDPTLRIYATGSYLDKYYPEGTSAGAPQAYTDRNATVSGSVQKDLRSRSLTLSAGGSYSRLLGIVDSNAYALNSSLIWRIGKLELSAGVDAYGSDWDASGAGQNNRNRQYYYFKMLRRLF